MGRYHEIKADPQKHREQLDRINRWRHNDKLSKDKAKADLVREEFLSAYPYWDIAKEELEEKEVYLLSKYFCLDTPNKQPSITAIAVELGLTKQGGHCVKSRALEKLQQIHAKVALGEKSINLS